VLVRPQVRDPVDSDDVDLRAGFVFARGPVLVPRVVLGPPIDIRNHIPARLGRPRLGFVHTKPRDVPAVMLHTANVLSHSSMLLSRFVAAMGSPEDLRSITRGRHPQICGWTRGV